MIVTITGGQVAVQEPDDCTRLHVAAHGLDDAATGAALRAAGLGEPGPPCQLWLDVAALRALARTGTPDWDARFEDMIEYARTRGWLDATGQRVAAHVERGAR